MSHAAFLAAVRAAPDDDTARLVYADYLDEQGGAADATRAEFIRLQIRLHTLDETDPERPALEDRENELLRAHEGAWLGAVSAPLARGLVRWQFERGFLGFIECGKKALQSSAAALFKQHPVSRVELASGDDEAIPALAKRAWWAQVRDLDTGYYPLQNALETLITSERVGGLRRLAFDAGATAPHLPDVLERCPSLAGLEELNIRDWRHDPALLLPALEASGVRVLRLSSCDFTVRGLKALLSSDFAARPVRIDLAEGNLGPALWPALSGRNVKPVLARVSRGGAGRDCGLPTLLSSPAAATMSALDVGETGLAGAKVRDIAASGFMARATEIGLTRCHVDAKSMAALAKTDAPHLRTLAVGDTGLRNAGVFALCDARWADSLTELDLMRNYLDDQALVAMANSGRFTNLRKLDLRVNSPDLGPDCRAEIGDAGVIALASAPNFARLRHLNLYRTRVTARGVEALLHSPHLRLAELELGGYDLGADLVRVLATAPRLARLTKLALSFTPSLGGDALLPLAESPHLSPLCCLDIRYNGTSERVSARLAARLGRRLEHYPAEGV